MDHHHHHHPCSNQMMMRPEGANNGGLLQVLDQHRVGEELDEWHQQLQDLEDHIRHCQCSCDHMGYGNYWSYNDANNKELLEMSNNVAEKEMSSSGPTPILVRKCSSNHYLHPSSWNNGGDPSIVSASGHHRTLSFRNQQYPSVHRQVKVVDVTMASSSTGGSERFVLVPGPASDCPAHRHLLAAHQQNGSVCVVATDPCGDDVPADDILDDDEGDGSIKSRTSPSKIPELGVKQWGILCVALLVALGTGVGVGVPLALRSGGSSLQERLNAVQALLTQVPLIDGHNDLPWNIRKFASGKLNLLRSLETGLQSQEPWSKSSWSHTDLPRLREGRLGAQFWSAYVPCGAQYLDAVKQTLEQIDLIKRMVDRYPHYLRLALDAQGIEDAHRDGRIASLLGVEGGHSLGNSMGVLRAYYDLGIRYVTLTHTCNTPWADCSVTEAEPHHPRNGGLTPFGKLMIKEMNRLGVMVDLSHTSSATMHHALDASQAPVIFSHSSTRALCNITRNVPDDVLKRLVGNGGIVMISFFSYFVSCNKTTTIQDVIAHVNHIRKIAGVDHVGIGAGYDGINTTPYGLEDVSKYPNLFAEMLLDPSWSEEDLKKLAGHNLLRVLRQVEKVRDDLQRSDTLPEEASIPHDDLRGQTHCIYQERGASQASLIT